MEVQGLVKKYRSIHLGDFEGLVSFYEEHKLFLNHLSSKNDGDFSLAIEILSNSVTSLYSLGRYSEVIDQGEKNLKLLEEQADQSFEKWKGANIKNVGFSWYGKEDYRRAFPYLREAVKNFPKDENLILFLKDCISKQYRKKYQAVEAIGFILGALCLLYEENLSLLIFSGLVATSLLMLTFPFFHKRRFKKKVMQDLGLND